MNGPLENIVVSVRKAGLASETPCFLPTKKQSNGLLSFLCYLDKIDTICLFKLFNKVINHLAEYTFSAIIDLSAVFAVLAVHNNMIKVLISKMGKSG